MSSFCLRQSSSLLNERMSVFLVSVEELGFAQRVNELVGKVLWVVPLLERLGKMIYFFGSLIAVAC